MFSTPNSRSLAGAFAAICCLTAAPQAFAHDGPIPDGHAPAGVMVDHMHKAGEFMIGYRYTWAKQDGDTLTGHTGVDNDPANPLLHKACQDPSIAGHNHCMMKQTSMTMQMHMLDLMYAPTDWLTLMVMPQWMTMDMSMDMVPGAAGHGMMAMGPHSHGTDGFGDTIFGALVQLHQGPVHHVHAGLMFSAPTGSVTEANASGKLSHYMMQLGSGTWDFLPSLTYTGRMDRWSWGLQASGAIRLEEENESHYRLGNLGQITGWAAYRWTNWMSTSVRLLYTKQGRVHTEGHAGDGMAPPDIKSNYGGAFTDIGLGVNFVVPDGALKGHRLGVEWMQPLRDSVNGYQQERTGSLNVNWSKAF